MSFQPAGENRQHDPDGKGLPKHWDALESDCCALCREPMTLFDHVDMWKCLCGFKITDYRKREIEESIREQDTMTGGYMIGNYMDEDPF